MESLILMGGLVFAAALGYFAFDRLGSALDQYWRPFWSEVRERAAVKQPARRNFSGHHKAS